MTLECHIVELREGGSVRAAAVLPDSSARLHLLLADGRHVRAPATRILHETGESVRGAGETAVAAALGEWERRANARAAEVDVPGLHELLASQDGAPLSLEDLAGLALGDDSGSSRAAVHRALAAATEWFRFSGEAWLPRPAGEVEAELQKRQQSEALRQARAAFVAAARARLRGGGDPLPEGSSKFLRALRDVALLGDQSRQRKEAAALVAELEDAAEASGPTEEHALELLVALGEMSADENLALLRAGVPLDFPQEIVTLAAEAGRAPLGEGRVDLRALPIVTIDDDTTTEIDDGVSLEPTPRGFRVGIHVADAAHFVIRDSPLDADAQARATSYYLPDRVIKMLPPVLATGAASLVAGEDRAALSFLVDVTPHGEVLGFQVQESVIRVAERMTYEDCEAALEGIRGPAWLGTLAGLARIFAEERLAAGATPIRAHEIAISFDEAGEPVITLIDPGRPARQFVAELMVLANRHVAQWCHDRGLPAIYRKQPRPSGAASPPPLDRIDPLAAFEFRKTLQRTEVSLEPGPHAGLGVPCYVQATSPIRRYQDLALHRVIKASLRGLPLPYTREELTAIAAATEAAGRQARSIETETDRYWILRALEKRVGDVLDAIVLRAEGRQALVELVEYSHVTSLAPRPDHRKGQLLKVRVRASRPRRGTLTLEQLSSPVAPA